MVLLCSSFGKPVAFHSCQRYPRGLSATHSRASPAWTLRSSSGRTSTERGERCQATLESNGSVLGQSDLERDLVLLFRCNSIPAGKRQLDDFVCGFNWLYNNM